MVTSSKEKRAIYQAQFSGVKKNGEGRVCTITIPQHVEDDRDRRAAIQPCDLTAFLMGDPPVGRRLHVAKTPSIVHDALDDLIFRRVSLV